jgi:AbrB family looped-hinge helix DNA binding protein
MKVMNEGGMESAITSKGQATIPKQVRQHLGLRAGDRVKFFLHPDGTVVLLPKRPASHLRGVIKSKRRAPSIKEMDKAIAAGAAERIARPGRR